MKLRFVCVLLMFSAVVLAEDAIDPARQDCADDNLCFIKVPGTQCADGTQTGFQVMYRKGAKNLFIYLEGGGACWSKDTCEKGAAKPLTAEKWYEGPYFQQTNLVGWQDLNNKANPVHQNYSMARIPYCTADIFMGNRVADYGTAAQPYVIRHVGYHNLGLILKEIRARFPDPDSVFFMGTSAGGLGVTFNLHQLRAEYPTTRVVALNDAGVPFKTPEVTAAKLEELYTSWGAHQTSPAPTKAGENISTAILEYNQKNFPDVSFGFIGSYNDWTMSFFANLLGGSLFGTVRKLLIDVADNYMGNAPNYKVFYLEDSHHGYASKDPSQVVSKGVKFSDWVNSMLNGANGWDDVRPDKAR